MYNYLLFLLILLLSFLSGYQVYKVSPNRALTQKEKEVVHYQFDNILAQVPELARVRLNLLYKKDFLLEVQYKQNRNININNYLFKSNRSLTQLCERKNFSIGVNTKERAFFEFLCQGGFRLNDSFFNTPPYILDNGQSFVFLAYLFDPSLYSLRWIQRHLHLVSPYELHYLPQFILKNYAYIKVFMSLKL